MLSQTVAIGMINVVRISHILQIVQVIILLVTILVVQDRSIMIPQEGNGNQFVNLHVLTFTLVVYQSNVKIAHPVRMSLERFLSPECAV